MTVTRRVVPNSSHDQILIFEPADPNGHINLVDNEFGSVVRQQNLELHVGMCRDKLSKPWQDDAATNGGVQANAQLSRCPLGALGEGCRNLVKLVNNASAYLKKLDSLRCQGNTSAAAIQQSNLELPFKRRDPLGRRGTRETAAFGGSPEASRFCDANE